MMKRLAVVVAILVGAAACSGGTNGDQWASLRGELVVQGISSESSRCVIAELEAAGIEPEALTTAADSATLAAGQAAYDAASAECFTDAEVGAIVEQEIEQILPEVAAALGITIEETRCVVDGFESQGLSFADVARGDGNPAVADAMAVLVPQCTGAAPVAPAPDQSSDEAPPAATEPEPSSTDVSGSTEEPPASPATPAPVPPAASDPATDGSLYDSPALRDLIIAGIADGTGESEEIATCILDETLAQGLTIEDFVVRGGDEDVVAAITTAALACTAG